MSPGSRNSQRSLLSQDLILETGRRIINDEGAEALSLRRLGSELGVTAPAMYAHVDSKEALLRGVAHAEFEKFVKQYEDLDEPDPLERLRLISRNYVRFARENPHLFRLMQTFPPDFFRRDVFSPSSPSPSLGSRLFAPRMRAINEAIDAGRIHFDDPFLVSLISFAAVQGLANFLLWRPPIEDGLEDELVEAMLDMILRGITVEGDPTH